MLEAIVIVTLLATLVLVFYPRPASLHRRKRKLSNKPYWLDKGGY